MTLSNQTIGIALAGGGAKTFAHLGVLQALAEANIYPSHISGTSIGAIIGALYAAGYSPTYILSLAKKLSFFKVISFKRLWKGLTYSNYFRQLLLKHFKENDFRALKKPLFVSTTNLLTAQNEILSSGKLLEALFASASFPVTFTPIKIGKNLYVDGAIGNNLPVNILRKNCDKVIAINICKERKQPIEKFEHLSQSIGRSFGIGIWQHVKPVLKNCDVVIDANVDNYSMWTLKKAEEIYKVGYETALQEMPNIKKQLAKSQLA